MLTVIEKICLQLDCKIEEVGGIKGIINTVK